MTILGIAIAIAMTFVLFSVSQGAQELIASAKELGPDIEVKSSSGIGADSSFLDENYAVELAGVEGVRKATPIIMLESMTFGGQGFMILVGMIPSDAQEIYGTLEVAEGRSLEDNDNRVIELGYQTARANNLGLGDNITLGVTNFEVICILEETGSIVDIIGVTPVWALQSTLGMENKASAIWIWVNDNADVGAVIQEIENSYLELKATEGITILKESEEFMKFGDAIRLTIAGIALLIGTLTAMNTVTMSTFERTREFGTMRSLGASGGYVFKLVLIESTILCTIGGVIGCLIGSAGSIAIERIILDVIGVDVVAVSPTLFMISIGIAFAVGLIAGIYPARRISKQQIVEALRYE